MIEKRILNEQDPKYLSTLSELAVAYRQNQQMAQAIELSQHVVATQEKTLGEQHPDRLLSLVELARSYLWDQQTTKAIKLLQHVTVTGEKSLDKSHPYYIEATARACSCLSTQPTDYSSDRVISTGRCHRKEEGW